MTQIALETQILAAPKYPFELFPRECFYFFDENAEEREGFFANNAGRGWRSGAVDASGALIGLPLGAKLMWYSYVENKFYHAVVMFDLGILQNELLNRLSLDTDSQLYQRRYRCIQFAIAPKGFVATRLGWAEVIEIAQTQAEVAKVSWSYFMALKRISAGDEVQERYMQHYIKAYQLEHIVQQYQEETFPFYRWKEYSTHLFLWQFVSDLEIYGYSEILINGNKKFSLYKNNETAMKKAAPALYRIYFKENNRRYKAVVNFSHFNSNKNENIDDDIDIFNLFKKFFGSSAQLATLFISKKEWTMTAVLVNSNRKVEVPIYTQYVEEIKDDEHLWFQ